MTNDIGDLWSRFVDFFNNYLFGLALMLILFASTLAGIAIWAWRTGEFRQRIASRPLEKILDDLRAKRTESESEDDSDASP